MLQPPFMEVSLNRSPGVLHQPERNPCTLYAMLIDQSIAHKGEIVKHSTPERKEWLTHTISDCIPGRMNSGLQAVPCPTL